MSNIKSNMFIALTKKIIWWCSGVNISLLSELRSEWQKFYAIGLSVILSGIVTTLSFIAAAETIFNNIYLSAILGVLFGGTNLMFDKFIISAFSVQKKTIKNPIFIFLRILLAVVTSIIATSSIQLIIYKNIIEERLRLLELGLTLLNKFTAFHELQNSDANIAILSGLIFIFFLVLEIIPFFAISLSPNGLYESALEFNDNLEKDKILKSLMLEREKFESNDNLEREKIQQNVILEREKLDRIYSFEREKFISDQDFLRQKNYLYEQQELQVIKENNQRLIRKTDELSQIPFGGLEFYIDYKMLPLGDINSLFASINNIYIAIYKIKDLNSNAPVSKLGYYNFEEILKSHPEDVLSVHSIETGNSITFKISTGWKPNIELIKGDFIISLPKGSVALLILGYLIIKIFDYSISNYKQLLEIQKLEKENKVLDNKLFNEQLDLFNSELELSSHEIKDNFQQDLFRFYELTKGNANFIQTKIIQDKMIIDKMEKGKLTVDRDMKDRLMQK